VAWSIPLPGFGFLAHNNNTPGILRLAVSLTNKHGSARKVAKNFERTATTRFRPVFLSNGRTRLAVTVPGHGTISNLRRTWAQSSGMP
jgi:hypothetical protein